MTLVFWWGHNRWHPKWETDAYLWRYEGDCVVFMKVINKLRKKNKKFVRFLKT